MLKNAHTRKNGEVFKFFLKIRETLISIATAEAPNFDAIVCIPASCKAKARSMRPAALLVSRSFVQSNSKIKSNAPVSRNTFANDPSPA